MIETLLGSRAPTGALAALEDHQIKDSLAELGYDTLRAVRHRLDMAATLSTVGEDGAWEGSEEQLLLQVLLSIDLPETEVIALDWMMSDPSPRAVAALSFYLGKRAPGVHDAVIRGIAEQSLLTSPSFSDVPGELFQLLGEYGDIGTVNLLADMPWHRDAYASVALALIPDGSGIDLLVRDARLFEQGQVTTHGRLALELLVQQAYVQPEAAEVLLDLAGQGLIPTDLWPDLLAAAAGDQEISLVRPMSGLQSMHTIFRPEGNQVFYRIRTINTPSEENEIDEFRIALLEELLQFAPVLNGSHRLGPGG